MAVIGWFARELWSIVKELKSDLSTLKEGLPAIYLRRDDFKEFRVELMNAFQRIEDKIERLREPREGT